MIYQSFSTHRLKVISKVEVFKNRSNSKVKVTRSKMLVPSERSFNDGCSSEHSHEFSPDSRLPRLCKSESRSDAILALGFQIEVYRISVLFLIS